MPNSFVQVVFDLPLHQDFTYSWSLETQEPQIGFRVKCPFGKLIKTGIVIAITEQKPTQYEVKAIEKVLDKDSLFGPLSLQLATWLANHNLCTLGQALFAMMPTAQRERERPLAEEEQEETADHDLVLTEEQTTALKTIQKEEDSAFYLWGLTGTGKTEVFLQTARAALNKQKQVLYLVPEIALTWQLISILNKRFGNQVAVLHSQLTPAQRLKEWHKIQRQEANLVVGPRSAVFAPFSDLGLIILDEEHENSYKSGQTPRYHARQVAFILAKKTKAKLIMGSATPSLEAVHLIRQKEIKLLTLTQRPAGGKDPVIEVVDVKNEKGIFSQRLIQEVEKTHSMGLQSILFLNRRGFSSSFTCRSCGYDFLCKNCSLPLTWHKNRGILLCHCCGWQTTLIHTCPQCGSVDVGWTAFGTERIEEEIQKVFPHLKVMRLDSDTAEDKNITPQILKDFYQGNIDVLVGTQMVAKGLNFPKVRLVGILNADQGLAMADFRATERVYNLLRQVSGRAGRYRPDGLVLIQTLKPESRVIKLASQGKDEEFWTSELETRKMLHFPPFSRLIRLVIRSAWQEKAWQTIQNLSQRLSFIYKELQDKVELLGPAECPVILQAGKYRYHILLRSTDFARMHHNLKYGLEGFILSKGVQMEIDVDPLNLI